jgi:histidinol-phosphate aminotransferase
MKKMDIKKILRKNIAELQPYSCARDEFKGEASVYLDANENPYNAPFNRYPDPLQWKLKEAISVTKQVPAENIFLGNGSDEPIDLLYRAFCEPRIDNVAAIDPTYGMYKVCANINDIEYRKVLLHEDFNFMADEMLLAADDNTKLMWLCSPNNPTGNSLNQDEIIKLLQSFRGIVVLDEAYIDFSSNPGFARKLHDFPNLVILQTFSKAWGSAAIRLGMAFASVEIVQVLNKIKYPYNINILTQKQALKALQEKEQVDNWVQTLTSERTWLIEELKKLNIIKHIYPTDANFVLVKVDDANAVYQYLVNKSIIVRNRSTVSLCMGCIRITVGTREENVVLIENLKGL